MIRPSAVVLGPVLAIALACVGPVVAGSPEVFGAGVQAGDTVSVADLLASPELYVDKVVRVEGTVAGVCPRAGCWMDLKSADGSREVRVKVEDGVIVFPASIHGKHAVAEGTFRKITLTRDQGIAYAKHQAEELGKAFDPERDPIPSLIYRIDGTGAVVHGGPES